MCDERFAGEMISMLGGLLSGGIASVVVLVVGRVVVEGRVVVVVVVSGRVVVVVVGRVVDVVGDEAVLVSGIVVAAWLDPAAAVPVGSSVVESVSSAAGEHAAISMRVARPSAAIRTGLRRPQGHAHGTAESVPSARSAKVA